MNKLRLDINDDTLALIKKGAAREGADESKYILNAIASYKLLRDGLDSSSNLRVAIVNKEDKVIKTIDLPTNK